MKILTNKLLPIFAFPMCLSMFIGCSENSATNFEKVSSPSFSPIKAFNEKSQVSTLYWKYKIVGDEIKMEQDGVTTTYSMGDMELSIDPGKMIRSMNFSGSISEPTNNMNGNFAVTVLGNLESAAGATMLKDTEVKFDFNMSLGADDFHMKLTAAMQYNPAVEWFLDCENLDELAIGYVYDEQGTINASMTLTSEVQGEAPKSKSIDNLTSAESWEIVDKLDSVTVQGMTYENVIVVDRKTLVPDSNLIGNPSDRITITYWVAKGIGMIRATGYHKFMEKNLDIELLETNLVVLN